jgi:hypothetical protein
MSRTGSPGRGSAAGAGCRGRRQRVLRGGAAVAVTGLGGASAALAASAALPIPVPCNTGDLAGAITNAPAGAILSLASGCDYAVTGALPDVTSTLTLQATGPLSAGRAPRTSPRSPSAMRG